MRISQRTYVTECALGSIELKKLYQALQLGKTHP